MKKALQVIIGSIGALGFLTMITALALGIWTEDGRWFNTAVLSLMVAIPGTIIAGTYPGWDEE